MEVQFVVGPGASGGSLALTGAGIGIGTGIGNETGPQARSYIKRRPVNGPGTAV